MSIRPRGPRAVLWTSLLVLGMLAGGCGSTMTDQPTGARVPPEPGPDSPVDPALVTAAAGGAGGTVASPSVDAAPADERPTVAEARAFVERANETLMDLTIRAERAAWVQANFITHDTEILAAEANERLIATAVDMAKQASRFDALELPPDVRRQIDVLKRAITMPAPGDPELTRELTRIATAMESNYGRAQYCPDGAAGDDCLDVGEITGIFAESRDPAELLDVWVGWRTTSPAIRDEYERFVELTNQGARELGYPDTGALWRSGYDMSPDAFGTEVDRLWQQVGPLYQALHCHVRAELAEHYGEDVVPLDRPIPAHLLGNIWAQQWGNVYELVAPETSDPGYDLTALLTEHDYDALEMVEYEDIGKLMLLAMKKIRQEQLK